MTCLPSTCAMQYPAFVIGADSPNWVGCIDESMRHVRSFNAILGLLHPPCRSVLASKPRFILKEAQVKLLVP
jgi:hypothetical protein